MKDSHELFKEMGFEAIKSTLATEKDTNKDNRALYAILGVLLFVGSEAIAVTFRKNFGRQGLNIGMIIVSFLCFAGIAAFSFHSYVSPDSDSGEMGTAVSFVVTGIVYSIIGIVVLWMGLHQCYKSVANKNHSNFTGDSNLLAFLKKDGWSNNQIKYIAEPGLVLAVGISYCFFNVVGGIALIFCAISVWARAIIETVFLGNPVLKEINDHSINNKAKSKNRVS